MGKAFGPDMHTPEMCVDEPFLRTFHLLDGQWEECTVENFHEAIIARAFFRCQCAAEPCV